MPSADYQLIKVYLQQQVLIGSLYYAATREARLLDALNGLLEIGPKKTIRFLELTEVTVKHADNRQEKREVSYINKANIQLAVTLGDANAGRGIGALEGPKNYPFMEKLPLPVMVETREYAIEGKMYRLSHQMIRHVLEDAPTFLPLTHALVITLATGQREEFPFVAVNKEHIMSLQALPKGR